MTNRELATTLKSTKNERRGGAPHDVWVERNRSVLLMQVRNTMDVDAKPGLGESLRHLFSIFAPAEALTSMAHAVGVFLLLVGTALGGGLASAQVYRVAAPGEMLYSVKIAVERAQLLLAPNAEYEAGLHAEFADRRIDEVAKLADGNAERQALLPGVLASFNKEVSALAGILDAATADNRPGLTDMAKLMERKMAVYQNELRNAAATIAPSHIPALAVSRDLVDGTTLKAIAVIVDRHFADAAAVPRTVVVTKFQERIHQAEVNLEAAEATDAVPEEGTPKTASVTKAKAALAEAKKLIKDEDYKAALTKMEEVAQLTKEAEEPAEEEEEAVTPEAPVTNQEGSASSTEEGAEQVAE